MISWEAPHLVIRSYSMTSVLLTFNSGITRKRSHISRERSREILPIVRLFSISPSLRDLIIVLKMRGVTGKNSSTNLRATDGRRKHEVAWIHSAGGAGHSRFTSAMHQRRLCQRSPEHCE